MAKKRKLSSFERSFVAARRSGAKDFSFGGKKYSTKRKDDAGGSSDAPKTSTPKSSKPANTPSKGPIPPSKPSQSSGHAFGVVGRGGSMTKRIFSAPDPKTLFADKGKESAKTSTPKPKDVPTPTPRPASPSERKARQDKAYQTNIQGAPATGESTFAKTVHGMENLRPAKPSKPTPAPQKPALSRQERIDSEWNARDVADTRKRMEEAKTPRPGKTGGVPSENRFVKGSISVAKAPQGKVVDASVNRGTPSIARPSSLPAGKTTKIGGTSFTPPPSGKTARLRVVQTAPKTDRLKKKTVVARKD